MGYEFEENPLKKKKKPLWKKLLSFFFSLIFTVALIGGTFYGFVYFKYKVDLFTVISQTKLLNEKVDKSNAFEPEDTARANGKISSLNYGDELVLTEAELAGYINAKIETYDYTINAGEDINLKDYGFSLIQIEFDNIGDGTTDKLTDFNAIIKLDLKNLKVEKLSGFPLSLLAKSLPNTLYLSCNCEINKDGENSYSTKSLGLKINNLSTSQTNSIFGTFQALTNLNSSESINNAICNSFVNILLGENGIFDTLKTTKDATEYSFETIAGKDCFVVYTYLDNHTITYHNTKGATNTNKTLYNKTHKIFNLKDLSIDGWTFLGWWDNSSYTGDKITSINATASTADYDLYAKWEIINYTIEYDLNGGTISGENPTTYNIETPSFTLINPTKIVSGEEKEFLGWTGTGLSEKTLTVTIEQGSFGDRNYTARYDGETVSVQVYVDGSKIKTLEITTGEKLDTDYINSLGLSGYSVNTWYSNAGMTNVFDIDTCITSDISVYGEWEYITNDITFYPYLTKFNNALSSTTINIASYNELVAYVDYVRFYDISNQLQLCLIQKMILI